MARRLFIGGINRWSDYRRGTLSIDQVLTYQIDACNFRIKGEKPLQGTEVIIEDDALGRLFAGIIDQVKLVYNKPPLVWQVDCQDYTLQMDKKLVAETYQGWTADAIARDMLSKYYPDFSTAGIRAGAPVVESTGADFSYKRPSECMKWLCDYIGWHWYVDYLKVVHFFEPSDLSAPAPISLTPGGQFANFSVNIEHQGLRNRVYVLGGTMLSDPQTIQWMADGIARQWVVPWVPHEATLKVGEVSKTVGIESVDEEYNFDYMLNKNDKYLRCSVQTVKPVQGATMALTARQDIDVIAMVEDLESQAAIAAIEGGDGAYEHSITDDSLISIAAAEAAGMADLREWANPRTSGSFIPLSLDGALGN